jgi:5-hydroxyisourate hydrolase
MSAITTHVLDTSLGRPAAGIRVSLEQRVAGAWREVGRGATDADGRCRTLMADGVELVAGTYRLIFDTGRYFQDLEIPAFHPDVTITFTAAPGESHYHVPLLLSPFGYTTYRGS